MARRVKRPPAKILTRLALRNALVLYHQPLSVKLTATASATVGSSYNPETGQAGTKQAFNASASVCPVNLKSEARNSKQILNPNVTRNKTKLLINVTHVMILFRSFEFWKFEIVSNFDIRYSDLIVQIGYATPWKYFSTKNTKEISKKQTALIVSLFFRRPFFPFRHRLSWPWPFLSSRICFSRFW